MNNIHLFLVLFEKLFSTPEVRQRDIFSSHINDESHHEFN
jgi:hypothetical protein